MRRLRKFLGIVTGSRARRWRRALAIHESHKWDENWRIAVRKFKETGDGSFVEYAVMNRAFYGTTWIGKPPAAP